MPRSTLNNKTSNLKILLLFVLTYLCPVKFSHAQYTSDYHPTPYIEKIVLVEPNEEMKVLFDSLIPEVSLRWRSNVLILGMGRLGIFEGKYEDTTYTLPLKLNYMLYDLELLKKKERVYSDTQLIRLLIYLKFLEFSSENVINIPKRIDIQKTSTIFPYIDNYCYAGDLQKFNYKALIEFEKIKWVNNCTRAEFYFRVIQKEIQSSYGNIEYEDGYSINFHCGVLPTVQSLSETELSDYIQTRINHYETSKQND